MEVSALENLNRVINDIGGFFRRIFDYLQPVMVFPLIVLILLLLFYVYCYKTTKLMPGTTQWVDLEVKKPHRPFLLRRHPMGKSDIAPLLIILAVFSFLALFRLGNMDSPQSFHQFNQDSKSVTIKLDEPEEISAVMYFTGMWTGSYKLEFSQEGLRWYVQERAPANDDKASPTPAMEQSYAHLFKWMQANLSEDNPRVSYIRISSHNSPIELGEVALYNGWGELIPASSISSPDAPELFDEQHLVPYQQSYMNSMYFDEIFHGRTALEHLRNIKPYEVTHPPLGKLIIASSIHFLGMTPFGWRFPGAVFGVLMLLVLYILLKNLFGKTFIAACGTLLFGFDFMRFTQTRIATIDTYGVFFILLACFFMYRYITTDPDAPFRKSLLPLALSGISFGVGCASKWIVIYAGLGLAVVYVIRLVHLAKHYNFNRRSGFGMYLFKTLMFSVLFFGIVPVAIYYLSYMPYGFAAGMTLGGGMLTDPEYFKIVWDNQVLMLTYHGKDVIGSTHPYSSQWWQWILDARPILYYNSPYNELKSSFAAFGNPMVWWGGIIAMFTMVYRSIRYRDGKALFILIGFLSQFLPWLPITRILFVYHYFPSTVFLVLAIAYVLNTILDSNRRWSKPVVCAYTALTGLLFVMFYPAISGVPAPYWYFSGYLRWIPGAWPF